MNQKPVTGTQLCPWLSVRSGAEAVRFYQHAFDAREEHRIEDPSGAVVSRLSIEGAEFWLSDESPEHANFAPPSLGGTTVKLFLKVIEPLVVFDKAFQAGATIVSPVVESHGWLVGRVMDPFGHHWEIGCPVE